MGNYKANFGKIKENGDNLVKQAEKVEVTFHCCIELPNKATAEISSKIFKLGEGSFGIMFCAEDKSKNLFSGEKFAIKYDSEGSEETKVSYIRELIASTIIQQNTQNLNYIRKIYSFGKIKPCKSDNGIIKIGDDYWGFNDNYHSCLFCQYIDEDGRFDIFSVPNNIKINIFYYLASGLNHLHLSGIIHNDLRNENLIASLQDFNIIDLGKSYIKKEILENFWNTNQKYKDFLDQNNIHFSNEFEIEGDYLYRLNVGQTATIETFKARKKYDIYSFCILGMMIFTGCHPFASTKEIQDYQKHPTMRTIISRMREGKFIGGIIRQANIIPKDLLDILMKCLFYKQINGNELLQVIEHYNLQTKKMSSTGTSQTLSNEAEIFPSRKEKSKNSNESINLKISISENKPEHTGDKKKLVMLKK